jgi:hypothetical protein
MPKFEHVGRNTEINGRKLEPGEVIEDPRPLDKIFLNKFKNLSAKPKKVNPPAEDGDDDQTPDEVGAQPAAADKEANAGGKDVPEFEDVTAKFPKAGKADLVVFEFKDGNFQIYDAADKDDPAATPINKSPLRTQKAVNEALDKYKS